MEKGIYITLVDLRDTKLTNGMFRLYCELKYRNFKKHLPIIIYQRTLGEKLGWSLYKVRRTLKKLHDKKYIIIHKKYGTCNYTIER
jgi:DNA-binding MarR family transcriptional regulator